MEPVVARRCVYCEHYRQRALYDNPKQCWCYIYGIKIYTTQLTRPVRCASFKMDSRRYLLWDIDIADAEATTGGKK